MGGAPEIGIADDDLPAGIDPLFGQPFADVGYAPGRAAKRAGNMGAGKVGSRAGVDKGPLGPADGGIELFGRDGAGLVGGDRLGHGVDLVEDPAYDPYGLDAAALGRPEAGIELGALECAEPLFDLGNKGPDLGHKQGGLMPRHLYIAIAEGSDAARYSPADAADGHAAAEAAKKAQDLGAPVQLPCLACRHKGRLGTVETHVGIVLFNAFGYFFHICSPFKAASEAAAYYGFDPTFLFYYN